MSVEGARERGMDATLEKALSEMRWQVWQGDVSREARALWRELAVACLAREEPNDKPRVELVHIEFYVDAYLERFGK